MVVIVPSPPQPSSNNDNANSAMQRVSDLWFNDGNLVVQAENKEFRIYRNLLASRSSVFSDMASFPQPSGHGDDGSVSTVVLPDSAVEVEHFLRAIYDSSYFEPHPGTVEAPALFGIARLSHKYNVAYLRRRALSHLNAVIPTSLEHIATDADKFFNRDRLQLYSNSSKVRPYTKFAVDLILLAREIGAVWLLPYAFYVIGSSNIEHTLFQTTLSEPDKRIALITRENHAFWVAEFMSGYGLDAGSLNMCESAICLCRINSAGILRNLKDILAACNEVDLLKVCLQVWQGEYEHNGFCAKCKEQRQNRYKECQNNIWNSLPKLVGYDTWEVLLQLKKQDEEF